MLAGRLSARRRRRAAAGGLYAAAVEQARHPEFYSRMGVPDTVDGRFELLCLHVILIVRRLREIEGEANGLAQALFDTMFEDMDRNLREMGVGDLSVGRHVRRMGQGFYGRAAAYEAGISAGSGDLGEALRRNLFGTIDAEPHQLERMVRYVRACAEMVSGGSPDRLTEGAVDFPDPAVP